MNTCVHISSELLLLLHNFFWSFRPKKTNNLSWLSINKYKTMYSNWTYLWVITVSAGGLALIMLNHQQSQYWIQTRITYVLITLIIRNYPSTLTIDYQSQLPMTFTRLRLHRFLALCPCGQGMKTLEPGHRHVFFLLRTVNSVVCLIAAVCRRTPRVHGPGFPKWLSANWNK